MPGHFNDEYDIGKAFAAIEEELIASMIRNMKRHKVEEVTENKQWTMWQAEQLKALERYKVKNKKKYGQQFKDINKEIDVLLHAARDEGEMIQEIAILRTIKKGFTAQKVSGKSAAKFFQLNERKLEALIEATIHDMARAETAVLRMANDKYRKIIFNSQMYANTGAGTYEKAVDMATKDFLAAGLNCVEYKNGARHTLEDYADMAIRTASKRAYLQGEGAMRKEWGIHTVIVNKRGNPCPKCLPFCGKVLIDDVWSGGSRKDGDYPLMSHAIARGLYHPRCKDIHTTYFPGISRTDDTWTEDELENIGLHAKKEARQQYAKRQADKFGRLARYSLDEQNRKSYRDKEKRWRSVANASISGIMKPASTKEVVDVHSVGKINRDIYKCVTDDIVTDEVIITNERMQHIKERHPNDYERFSSYFSQIVSEPDFIIESKKKNTALILKEIQKGTEIFKTVLRLATSKDNPNYKNSIITFMKIDEKEWKRLLRNKKILYKKE